MTELETRLPCPACLGTRMEKIQLEGAPVTLDRCQRCGGIWFEKGEVHQVRGLERTRTLQQLGASVDIDVARAPCHGCRAPVARDQQTCPACGHHVRLACPICQNAMTPARVGDLHLDACRRCRGVWLDRHELAEIWSDSIHAALVRRRRAGGPDDLDSLLLLDVFLWSPDLLFLGAHAAGELTGAAGGLLPAAADTVGGAAQAAGEAAASIFETIAEIIGGLFS